MTASPTAAVIRLLSMPICQPVDRVAVADISREWSAAHPTDERKAFDYLLL